MSGYSYDDEYNNPSYSDGNGFEGLGDDASGTPTSSDSSWWQTLVTDTAPALGKELNTLVGGNSSSSTKPTATFNLGIDPQTQSYLIYGALGIGALFLVSMMLKKKR